MQCSETFQTELDLHKITLASGQLRQKLYRNIIVSNKFRTKILFECRLHSIVLLKSNIRRNLSFQDMLQLHSIFTQLFGILCFMGQRNGNVIYFLFLLAKNQIFVRKLRLVRNAICSEAIKDRWLNFVKILIPKSNQYIIYFFRKFVCNARSGGHLFLKGKVFIILLFKTEFF